MSLSPRTVSTKDAVLMIRQFLDEEKYGETLHLLEKEAGVFFDMKHFEDVVTNGEWEAAEKYLSGFTTFEDNRHSRKIFFEIWKQQYIEALDRSDHEKAVEILTKNLKVVSTIKAKLFEDLTNLLTLNNIRENNELKDHGDTKSARAKMLEELKGVFEANPLLLDKLQSPSLENSTLRTLYSQSRLAEAEPDVGDFPAFGVPYMPLQPASAPLLTLQLFSVPHEDVFVGPSSFSVPHQVASAGPISSSVPHQAASAGPTSFSAPYWNASAGHMSFSAPYWNASAGTMSFSAPYWNASAGFISSSVPHQAVSVGPSSSEN